MYEQRSVKGWKNSFSDYSKCCDRFYWKLLCFSFRSFGKVQETEARPKNWLVSICFDNKKLIAVFSFLTDYSLNFQCQVAKFSPTCCLKNSHHNDIKLFRQNLEELWEKQIKLFTFLHFGFLSNDAVKMRL